MKLCSRSHGEGHEENVWLSPANMDSVLVIEMPDPGGGATTASSFMATDVDGSGAAMYMDIKEGALWYQASLLVAILLVVKWTWR